MGIMDKAKFWKKEEEDIGDLSGLGDFGLDDEHGAEHPGMGNLPPPADMGDSGMHPDVPGMEEVPPTQGSRDMGDRLGLRPATPEQHAQSQQPMGRYYPQQARESPVMGDMAKDIEI
ncbi:TPA: hypothetical protein HA265_04665, partial [Candidatus Woesearchaeota archaeon]|nr:hypothetical protein [Candidatus Woesearchaeota archaeon]